MRSISRQSLNTQFLLIVGLTCVWMLVTATAGFVIAQHDNTRLLDHADRKAQLRTTLAELSRLSQQVVLLQTQHDAPLSAGIAASLDAEFRSKIASLRADDAQIQSVLAAWQTLLSTAADQGSLIGALQQAEAALRHLHTRLNAVLEQELIALHASQQRHLMLTGIALLLGILFGAWAVMRRVQRLSGELHQLGQGMGIAAVGQLSHRVYLKGCSELDALSAGFNYMSGELESQEQALRLREQGLLTVMNSAPDAIITIDMEGVVLGWNAAAEQMSAYTESDTRGTRLHSVFDPGQHADLTRILRECRDFQGGATSRSAGPWELTIRRKDGLHRPVEVSLRDMEIDGRRGFVVIARDITERKAAAEKLAFLTQHDSLTQLPNRALTRDLLARAMKQAETADRLVGVLTVGVNRFSEINDNLGHSLGDALLIAIAERLDGLLARPDVVGRLGGDEFCVVLGAVRHVDAIGVTAERLTLALAEPFKLGGHDIFVSASIGVAVYPFDDASPEVLLRHASAAMYRCKRLGDTACLFYADEMNRLSADRITLTAELQRAAEDRQFEVYYQPMLSTADGGVTGAEALLRWNHPTRGVLFPADFLELLQDTGLIVHVGRWLLDQVCRQSADWLQSGLAPLRISVNLSARQFSQPGFIEDVLAATRELRKQLSRDAGVEVGLAPLDCLEFELTEDMLVEHTDASLHTLLALREMGIKLSVDDFGTGYSSLSYLKQFPIDSLKIDQSFVRDIGQSQDAELIVQAIIDLAHNLRMDVVGEGVETRQQRDFLRDKGCDLVQGHLYGAAMPADTFEAFIRTHRQASAG